MKWELVGTLQGVIDKGIYTNGADMVFTNKDGQVLAVELKNVVGNADLGTLGKNTIGNYGGSIDRVISSAGRFLNSSNEQLRLESEAIDAAAKSGNLQNALFTTADRVSQGAQNIYNGVYTSVRDNYVNVTKALPTASAGALGILQTTVQAVGGFLNSCETFIMPFFFYFDFNPLENKAVST